MMTIFVDPQQYEFDPTSDQSVQIQGLRYKGALDRQPTYRDIMPDSVVDTDCDDDLPALESVTIHNPADLQAAYDAMRDMGFPVTCSGSTLVYSLEMGAGL